MNTIIAPADLRHPRSHAVLPLLFSVNALFCGAAGATEPTAPALSESSATVQLAICLDTSGSMDGLIDSAKQKIWAVVNDLALIDPTPTLEVALLSFGNDGHSAENGWVHVETPFTSDLDLLSARLFVLSTNGGTELVGRVLQHSDRLRWSNAPSALKLVVVAGNESADQDREVSFRDICRQLIGRGIMVNAIYCGSPGDAAAVTWQEVASLTDGHFSCIDQNHGTLVVSTPFDAELGQLNAELSATYLPVGAAGVAHKEAQLAADRDAAAFGGAGLAARAKAKATALYTAGWDLIDQVTSGAVDLEELEADELPAPLRELRRSERSAYVQQIGRNRAAVEARIEELDRQRRDYISREVATHGLDESRSFDAVLRSAIRKQAKAKGMHFRDE
jgi:hypothetical protein